MPQVHSPELDIPAKPTALSYGRGQRGYQFRWRHAFLVGVLVLCTSASWMVGRTARAKAQVLIDENAAASFVLKADTVVFDSDPASAAKLIDAGTHQSLSDQTDSPAAILEPAEYARFKAALGTAAAAIDEYGALVFLHELTTSSGTRRIVAVRFLPWVIDGKIVSGTTGLVAQVFEPGGLFHRAEYLGDSNAPVLLPALEATAADDADAWHWTPGANPCLAETSPLMRNVFDPYGTGETAIRWYAGQPDLTDSSHFTLDFQYNGQRGTVDGYLTADGSAIEMFVRPPLEMARAAPAPKSILWPNSR